MPIWQVCPIKEQKQQNQEKSEIILRKVMNKSYYAIPIIHIYFISRLLISKSKFIQCFLICTYHNSDAMELQTSSVAIVNVDDLVSKSC